MTTPTSSELAAAREIAAEIARWSNVDYPHVNIASIIAKHRSEEVKELQRKAKALDEILKHASRMQTHQLPTIKEWVRFQFPVCAGNYQVESLLEAIEAARKGQQ